MSNLRLTQFRYGLEKKIVDLFAKVTFGASGAPTLSIPNSKGITSVVRNSAGDYTFTFKDKFQKYLMVKHVFLNATAPAAPSMFIKAVTPNTCEIVFNVGGTSTDPANGEVGFIQFTMNDTTAF